MCPLELAMIFDPPACAERGAVLLPTPFVGVTILCVECFWAGRGDQLQRPGAKW